MIGFVLPSLAARPSVHTGLCSKLKGWGICINLFGFCPWDCDIAPGYTCFSSSKSTCRSSPRTTGTRKVLETEPVGQSLCEIKALTIRYTANRNRNIICILRNANNQLAHLCCVGGFGWFQHQPGSGASLHFDSGH